MDQVETSGPLQREIRTLTRALIVFILALIIALLALVVTLLRMNRLAATADAVRSAVGPIAFHASRENLRARLELLHRESGISRIEVYRGGDLYAAAGEILPSAEVITRPLPGGRLLLYFDVSSWLASRRTAVVIGALATLATLMGLLILILYLPKFVRPLGEMLGHAQQIGSRRSGDDDARYLVHTFREAVEKIQRQGQELDHLRDATTLRTPDIRELASTIHRNFSSGFLALDAYGNIVALNETGRGILGFGSAEDNAVGTVLDLPVPFAAMIRASLESRVAVTRREVLLDHSEVLIGVTTVPLFEGETFLGIFVLFTDLTTLRAMEGRLRDFENLVGLGQMSAGIAHEFRNSLFAILGYLRLAQRGAAVETAGRIEKAEAEAHRLAAAVDTLLNFARPLTIRSQRLSLDDLARAVIERLSAEAPDVSISFSAAECEINGDRELLERALENIVRNAIDAVRERHVGGGGRVDVDVTIGQHAAISVRDNGAGVEPEDAERLLLPFQSAKPHGFGLGLPLARKIALHHGGTLTLAGVPGEGTTVTLEFFR